MIKNQRYVAQIVAQSLGVSENEVSQVLNLFYKTAKQNMEEIVDNEIYLYGLGSFVTKRKKLYDQIIYYEVRKKNISESNKPQELKETLMQECDEKIQALKERVEDYRKKDLARKIFKQNQNEQTTVDGGVQESESDLGRS